MRGSPHAQQCSGVSASASVISSGSIDGCLIRRLTWQDSDSTTSRASLPDMRFPPMDGRTRDTAPGRRVHASGIYRAIDLHEACKGTLPGLSQPQDAYTLLLPGARP